MSSVQNRLIQKITYKDVQVIMHTGYIAFFQSYNWPFRKLGRKIQIYDNDTKEWQFILPEELDYFLNNMFSRVEKMFAKFVEINKWLNYDPDFKYPKYSLKVYGKKPIAKIKALLYKKNTV
jgi:hypothetical protein